MNDVRMFRPVSQGGCTGGEVCHLRLLLADGINAQGLLIFSLLRRTRIRDLWLKNR